MTVPIVLGTFVRIGQHLKRLVDLLEFFLRRFVAGVQIGVIFFCKRTVRPLDLRVIGILGNAEYLVIVSLLCHMVSLSHSRQSTDRTPPCRFINNTALRERAKIALSRRFYAIRRLPDYLFCVLSS